ncbi:hypothetical protein ACX3VG_25985, partial [Escherichia coli]
SSLVGSEMCIRDRNIIAAKGLTDAAQQVVAAVEGK